MRRSLGLLALSIVLLAGCALTPGAPAAGLGKIDTGVSPEEWADVPAGPFLMGPHNHVTEIKEPYQIMVTPVTNAQFCAYLNKALADKTAPNPVKIVDGWVMGYYKGDPFSGRRHEKEIAAGYWRLFPVAGEASRLTYDGKQFTVVPGYENHPVTLVTWFGATAYCEANGWRLPTEAEWEKAARGDKGERAFPWGKEIVSANANYYGSGDPFEWGVGKQGDTTPVGFYNGHTYDGFATIDSKSPYGLYDMAGNVWQWTADVYEGAHYRYLRGGSKADYGFDLRVWTRNNAEPDYSSPSVGFRCVRPASK